MDCAFCQSPLPEESRFCMMCGADLSDPEVSTRQRAAIKELFEEFREAVESRYRVVELLGRGAMGAVFLAEDLRLGRMVALKVLRPELADESAFVGRFEREARIAARLDHANIIPIYEVERAGDFHYFAMKHVAGKSLDELLATKSLSLEQALEIVVQAARGLGHAHRRGVIHRDVKPSNIMVDDDGQVLITDFGISKALESKTQYTSAGQLIGTPRYLSPEQAKGQAMDGRGDQYSLAVVAYEAMVGQLPLMANSVHGLMYAHVYDTPTPARTVRPEVPAHVSATLQRALAKEPAERFPSMEEFAQALEGGGDATRTVPRPEARGSGSVTLRHKLSAPLWIGGAGVLLIAGVTVALLWNGRHEDIPAEAAQIARDTTPPAAQTATAVEPETLPPVPPAPSAADTAAAIVSDSSPPTPPARRSPRRERPTRAVPKPAPASDSALVAPTARDTARAARGYVTVNAVPYGTVAIDGVEVGDTPVFRQELSPGVHAVVISRPGFRSDSSSVNITSGNEVRLSRTLVRESP